MLGTDESISLIHELAFMGWLLVMMFISFNSMFAVNINWVHLETVKCKKQLCFGTSNRKGKMYIWAEYLPSCRETMARTWEPSKNIEL